MIINVNSIEIVLDLEPSQAYVLSSKAGIGKTYLYDMLKAYENFGNQVVAVTYDRQRTVEELRERMDRFSGSIVLFDRFDRYFDKEVVSQCTNKGCSVLVDLKSNQLINQLKVQSVYFNRSADKIEVLKW
jgi:hypothetical protein